MTIRRFEVVPLVGTGDIGLDAEGNVTGPEDPIRPNIAGSYVVLGRVGNRVLVMRTVPDGTAQTQGTLADMSASGLDVNATALTAAQRTAVKTFLANSGVDVSGFDADNPDDRRKLLVFILRRVFGWKPEDFKRAFTDYGLGG